MESENKYKKLALFTIISGLGALWLSIMYYVMSEADILSHDKFDIYLTIYYIINSFLMIISGIVLIYNKYRIYIIISLFLLLSVVLSFLVPHGSDSWNLVGNVFMMTAFLSMTFGIQVGGIVLTPMFLGAVFLNGFKSWEFISDGAFERVKK